MEIVSKFGNLISLFETGGIAGVLIAACAILLIVVGIERFIWLFVLKSYKISNLLEGMRPFIIQRNYSEALQVASQNKRAPQMEVVKAALLSVENGREAMKSAQGSELVKVIDRCEDRLPLINLIANIATLLGLLGTITGLIKTFEGLAALDASQKAKALGAGISEAMNSTAVGLSVGIFAMIVHSIYTTRAERIISSSQDAGLKVISWVEQAERVEVKS